MTVAGAPADLLRPGAAQASGPARERWSYQHYLSVVAAGVIVVEVVVWCRWLAAGPVQITKYRDTHLASWWIAGTWEGLSILTLLVAGTWVVRGAQRARRLTVEAQFCIAGLLTYWQDPLSNSLQPLFFNSANWVNLNEWTGYVPFVRNPDAGRMPEPILFGLPLYACGFLVFALLIRWVVGRVSRRFPGLRAPHKILIAIAIGGLVDASLEIPLYLAGLWAYPGQPGAGLFAGTGHRYPVTELVAAGAFFGVLASMLMFRDDRGRCVTERGLGHLPQRRQALLSLLALVAVFNLAYGADNAWFVAWGLDSAPYRHMRPNTVAGLCDAPGFAHTNYGTCPGTPGYRVPLPGDLRCPRPGGSDADLNGPAPCPGAAPVVVGGGRAPNDPTGR